MKIKRIFAALLVFALVFTMLPTSFTYAADDSATEMQVESETNTPPSEDENSEEGNAFPAASSPNDSTDESSEPPQDDEAEEGGEEDEQPAPPSDSVPAQPDIPTETSQPTDVSESPQGGEAEGPEELDNSEDPVAPEGPGVADDSKRPTDPTNPAEKDLEKPEQKPSEPVSEEDPSNPSAEPSVAPTEPQKPDAPVETPPSEIPTDQSPSGDEIPKDPYIPSEPTQEAIPEVLEGSSIVTVEDLREYMTMPLAGEEFSTTMRLFDYAPMQVSGHREITVTYDRGSGKVQNLAWHYADNPSHLIYCLEPAKPFAGGNTGDSGVPFEGQVESVAQERWYELSEDQREAVGLILLYGCPNGLWDTNWGLTASNDNPNKGYRAATQILIWEIVTGIRTAGKDSGYVSTGNGYVSSDIYYNNYVGTCVASNGVDYFLEGYKYIVSCLRAHSTIPSFTSAFNIMAPTIQLTGPTKTVTDTNGVLSRFSFTNTDTVSFSKNGNDLTITASGALDESKVYTTQAQLPSAENTTYTLWYKGSGTHDTGAYSFQTLIDLYSPAYDPVPAYFKLKSAGGTATMKKTTTASSGDVAGYCFKIYNWETNTTWYGKSDSSGNIYLTDSSYTANNGYTFEGLPDGSYTFLEVLSLKSNNNVFPDSWKIKVTDSDGNVTHNKTYSSEISEDANGDARLGTADAKIVISGLNGGGAMEMVINNAPQDGQIIIRKTTNTGKNLGRWEFKVYTDSALKNLYGTYYTDSDTGTVTISNVPIGKYYIKETASSDSYWVCDSSVKTVVVESEKDATVTVNNNQYGRIKVTKTSNTGENSGWTFDIKDSAGTIVATLKTGADGTATTENLLPGKYTVTERGVSDTFWECDVTPHTVTVAAGATANVSVENNHYGRIRVIKTSNTGENSGWIFDIRDASGKVVETVKTGADGTAVSGNLPLGSYTVTERDNEDSYWVCDVTAKNAVVEAGKVTDITVNNTHYGRIKLIKIMDTDGPVSGWEFRITRLSDNKDMGTYISSEDGTITTENLMPGDYLVEELIPKDSLYYCKTENPVTITVTEGETIEVSFTNALRPGKIIIEKVDFFGNHLAGAKFLLEWSEDGNAWTPVTYSAEEDVAKGTCGTEGITDGWLITDDTGIIVFENLYPAVQYRVTELEAPDGYILLKEPIYIEELPVDDLTIEKTVHNSKGYTLPTTGIGDSFAMITLSTVAVVAVIAACAYILMLEYNKNTSTKEKGGK